MVLQADRALGRGLLHRNDRDALFQETGGVVAAYLAEDIPRIRERNGLSPRVLVVNKAKVKGQFEERDAAGVSMIRRGRVRAKQQDVTADHPGRGKVNELVPLRQVGHQGPKIDQPLPERLFGTRAGLDPLQSDACAPCGFVDDLDRQPAKATVDADLKWGVRLEANAQRTFGERRKTSGEI